MKNMRKKKLSAYVKAGSTRPLDAYKPGAMVHVPGPTPTQLSDYWRRQKQRTWATRILLTTGALATLGIAFLLENAMVLTTVNGMVLGLIVLAGLTSIYLGLSIEEVS